MSQLFIKRFKNKKVIITGHTGFKGSWLSLWLVNLGAKVTGLSIDVPTKPSHFRAINLQKRINHKKVDIRNLKSLKAIFKKTNPDYVFHLAAQSLVKKSYAKPIYTWTTNTLGTLNVLESLRVINKNCVAILITSDKAYKNLEIKRGYNEDDRLGGKDPYSASKASADLAIQSYISAYFGNKNQKIKIGIARAGNVIGGGDWSGDRLIPDCVKSWSKNKKVLIRSPRSTRPWQHVLEAISGYIFLALKLKNNSKLHGEAFNFGPNNSENNNVLKLVKTMKKFWERVSWKIESKNKKKFFESSLLKLNSQKAYKKLQWKSVLSFKETIMLVSDWYKMYYSKPNNSFEKSIEQIEKYEKLLKKRLLI